MCFDIRTTEAKLCTNYVPKCQMRWSPYGPIFWIEVSETDIRNKISFGLMLCQFLRDRQK